MAVLEQAAESVAKDFPFTNLTEEEVVIPTAPAIEAQLINTENLTADEEWDLQWEFHVAKYRDSINIAANIDRVNALNAEKDKAKWEMINTDFPTLTQKELEDNIDLIDEYYIRNLEFCMIKEVAENGNALQAKGSNIQNKDWSDKECSAAAVLSGGVAGALVALVSMKKAADNADAYAGENFPKPKYDGSGDRRDAFRHIMWNALMCKYYVTVSANIGIRVDMAREVATAYEQCGDNPLPHMYMDIHNNKIGRDLYATTSWYTRV